MNSVCSPKRWRLRISHRKPTMSAVHSAWIESCCSQSTLEVDLERPPDDPLPHRALLGGAQRVGLAARKHGRHAGPEELRRQRGHERGNADFGDDHAVDEADHRARGEADKHRPPTEIVLLEQHGEYEAGEGDDRREAQVDLARADDESEPGGEQHQRRKGREEGRVDEGPEEHFRRRVHEQQQQQRENDDDRQRLEALDDRRIGHVRALPLTSLCCSPIKYSVSSATDMSFGLSCDTIRPRSSTMSRSATSCTCARLCSM